MKVTDYIIEFLISKGITDIFGYPGGVICHLMDSVTKYPGKIKARLNYHEQAAAFAACGYAQETCGLGVAFATSGPGATNLMTGIANAYFDSIPVIFLTGQVDTYALKGEIPIRQCGFQETDIVSMAEPITKYAVRVDNPTEIKRELEKAYNIATGSNPGPVVIDLPADVQRADIELEKCMDYTAEAETETDYKAIAADLNEELQNASRPCLLIGNGVKQAGMVQDVKGLIKRLNIPAVFSMPAFDTLPYSDSLNFGFIGANGHRYANFVLGKSDLIIVIGSRLDLKQVGSNRKDFAPQARIIRIDIDAGNLAYHLRADEKQFCIDLRPLIKEWYAVSHKLPNDEWVKTCMEIKEKLQGYDDERYTELLCAFGKKIPKDTVITVDVGQNQVWLAQQLQVKEGQTVHMSAGHGAMGYSLPAAIGCFYGTNRQVFSFNGDGGIQMNLQELQFLAREQLPVKVVILNNHSLGMIRGFQEANFERNYTQTTEGTGYSAPDFKKIAAAYGLEYIAVASKKDLNKLLGLPEGPAVIEIQIQDSTVLNPNFGRNGQIQDQRPYLDRTLFQELMDM